MLLRAYLLCPGVRIVHLSLHIAHVRTLKFMRWRVHRYTYTHTHTYDHTQQYGGREPMFLCGIVIIRATPQQHASTHQAHVHACVAEVLTRDIE